MYLLAKARYSNVGTRHTVFGVKGQSGKLTVNADLGGEESREKDLGDDLRRSDDSVSGDAAVVVTRDVPHAVIDATTVFHAHHT